MPPHDPHDGLRRRGVRPGFEGLETRDLPASHPLGLPLPGGHSAAADVQQFVPILYPPGTPQPTAAEIQRESFVAKGIGRYTVGPGRFSTQEITIHGYGKPESNNQSQHGHFQYILYEPTDPTKSITGVAHFLVQDFLASSASLILDLQGPVGSEVNVDGVNLPTHANWVHDGTSGTTYIGTETAIPGYANFPSNYFTAQGTPANPPPGPNGPAPSSVDNWNLGVGDATFKYTPDKHPLPGTMGSGTVSIVFRGLINFSGAQNAPNKNVE